MPVQNRPDVKVPTQIAAEKKLRSDSSLTVIEPSATAEVKEVRTELFSKSVFQSTPGQAAELLAYANPVNLDTTKVDDLVVPAQGKAAVDLIVQRIQQNDRLQKEWTFATQGGNQPGINILITGDKGLGKTTAARVIAKRVDRPLYRLDLGKVLGANPAETMAKLSRAFSSASSQGAILLIDNAEVLLNRMEGAPSSDRQVTAHMKNLLQEHHGVVILSSSHLQENIHDVVSLNLELPFPDEQLRKEIWQRALPPGAPHGGIDFAKLARAQLTGANICNIVLNAATEAASQSRPISMPDLMKAMEVEHRKLGRPFIARDFA